MPSAQTTRNSELRSSWLSSPKATSCRTLSRSPGWIRASQSSWRTPCLLGGRPYSGQYASEEWGSFVSRFHSHEPKPVADCISSRSSLSRRNSSCARCCSVVSLTTSASPSSCPLAVCTGNQLSVQYWQRPGWPGIWSRNSTSGSGLPDASTVRKACSTSEARRGTISFTVRPICSAAGTPSISAKPSVHQQVAEIGAEQDEAHRGIFHQASDKRDERRLLFAYGGLNVVSFLHTGLARCLRLPCGHAIDQTTSHREGLGANGSKLDLDSRRRREVSSGEVSIWFSSLPSLSPRVVSSLTDKPNRFFRQDLSIGAAFKAPAGTG